MKRLYALLAFMLLAIIGLNLMVLYLIITRPSTPTVRQLISSSAVTDRQINEKVAKAVAQAIPEAVKGDKGEPGTPGKTIEGPAGKDGLSIVGPKGEKGEAGAPGRELELARDPETGELYSRYSGDAAWTLVEAPR